MAGLNALVRALNTNVEWLREHTRYLTLARSWDEAGRRDNRLLFGTDITAVKDWVGRRPKSAPELTELHLDFIRASEADGGGKGHANGNNLRKSRKRRPLAPRLWRGPNRRRRTSSMPRDGSSGARLRD